MKMDVKRDRPRGWPLSPSVVRAVLSGHGILGLAFAAIIYLVCFSGTLAVFVHDFERWEMPGAPAITRIDDGVLTRAIGAAQKAAPANAAFYVTLPSDDEAGAAIIAYTPTFEKEWAVGPNGELVEHRTPFSAFLLELHVALHLPRSWGGFIVGLTGVALLSSLVSGILAHPRVFKDAFHLRLGGSRRLQEADLHNRLGIWALPFHVVIALTGALLGLSTIIVGVLAMLLYRGDTAQVYALFIDPPPAVDATPAPPPPVGAILAEARRLAPGAEPAQLVIQNLGRADARVAVSSERDRLLVPQDGTTFDARGRVFKDEHPGDQAAGTLILGGIGQLHFGWFGGVPVRIVYGLLGIALCVVTSSGVTIWLARRRDKGRAVPQWERLWAATAWGQPLALVLAALATLLLPIGDAVLWVWLGLTVAMLFAAGAMRSVDALAGAAWLRAGSGGAAILLALAHIAMMPVSVTGSIIDALLLVSGGWLLWRRKAVI